MKTFIFSLFLIVAACSSQKIEDKNLPSDDTTDKISTHKMEWEKNKEMQLGDELKTKSSISALNSQSITESSNGNFGMPAFSQDGQYLFYTNMDYSEIWRYNLKSNFSEKLVEMQSSGVNFQISFDGNTIYFRNKATSGKRSSSMYSILKHSIPDKKNELIFSSKERISTPILVYDWLYFIQDGKPKSFNLITNQIGSEFKTPFYYVDDNYLIKYTVKPDTIMLENGSYKFINCNYTTDLGFITILTASQGIVVLDIEGNLINTFRGAKSIDKLSYSNLVVYTEEEDDGKQITSSELFIGFLNSNKKLKIDNPENELRFNPRWSNNKNMITYTNGQGQIKTITLNVDVK